MSRENDRIDLVSKMETAIWNVLEDGCDVMSVLAECKRSIASWLDEKKGEVNRG